MRLLSGIYFLIQRAFTTVHNGVEKLNRRMAKRYTPRMLALLTLVFIGGLAVMTLFFPFSLGLSNNGSYNNAMADAGLARMDPDLPYFSYYEMEYQIETNRYPPKVTPFPLLLMIKTAIAIDIALTGDSVFDVRVLAACYLVLYLLVLWPLLKRLFAHIKTYTEGMLLVAACVLILADVSLITRLTALNTQPLELIVLIALTDAALFTIFGGNEMGSSVLVAMLVSLLMAVNHYAALSGVVFSVFFWRMAFGRIRLEQRFLNICCSLLLCFISVVCLMNVTEGQTREQKYNSMTRGVLFQAKNPAEALAEFGIEERFSILTETYAEQAWPVVDVGDKSLDEGFLNRYDAGDIAVYYLLHPSSVFGMINADMQSIFMTRPDLSGNYRVTDNRPPYAKSLFMSVWSSLKQRSAPRSLAGFALIGGLALWILNSARKNSSGELRSRREILLFFLVIVILFLCVELTTVAVVSGDSEMMGESFLAGVCLDLMVLLILEQIVCRVKNIGDES